VEEHIIILVIALVILSYGYISNFLARYDISGPMVFTGLGLLFSPLGLNFAQLNIDANMVTVLVEIALVLVLFSDAALLDLGLLKQSWKIPARLLFIGLPITVVAGTIAGKILFPQMPFLDLLLLALILTPTDAALGKAVVSDPIVPKTVRSTINVESGLNDGIIFPVLITVVAAISAGIHHEPQGNWMIYVAEQIVFGGLAGWRSDWLLGCKSADEVFAERVDGGDLSQLGADSLSHSLLLQCRGGFWQWLYRCVFRWLICWKYQSRCS
jgi:NhaP-type Na+/H+ or K+/H+ antiporter